MQHDSIYCILYTIRRIVGMDMRIYLDIWIYEYENISGGNITLKSVLFPGIYRRIV